jgi:putative oxidoreductase
VYENHTLLQTVGQLLMASIFIITGIVNASTKFQQHLDRMVAAGVPLARACLVTGFALQITGGALVALDYHRDVGAVMLIVFTILATAIFHQYWKVQDPLRRHLHISFIYNNTGLVGGLLWLI